MKSNEKITAHLSRTTGHAAFNEAHAATLRAQQAYIANLIDYSRTPSGSKNPNVVKAIEEALGVDE